MRTNVTAYLAKRMSDNLHRFDRVAIGDTLQKGRNIVTYRAGIFTAGSIATKTALAFANMQIVS